MRGKWEQSWGGEGNDSRCGDENRPLKVSLQATTFRVEGGSNIFKSETIKCFIIFYFHWIQHIHKLDEEIFYHLSKLWALSGVITFFHPILFVWNHQIVPQVMTVLSLTLLHIVPLVSLTYLNYAIFCAIRWTSIQSSQSSSSLSW